MDMNMEKKLNSGSDSDRISQLPDPIKAHILSLLPTRNAVKTSILSNSWRTLWLEIPALRLDEYHLHQLSSLEILPTDHEDIDDAAREKKELIIRKRDVFYAFIDRALGSMSNLKIISLYIPHYGLETKPRIDRWVDCVVGCSLKCLKLEFGGRKQEHLYSLPKSLFCVKSIMELELNGCELNSGSLADTQLPFLHKLSLGHVDLDEKVMEILPHVFPNLEVFTFRSCNGLTRLKISGLTKLVKVEVKLSTNDIEEIEIDAPNLLEFNYENGYDTYDDSKSCDLEISACKNVKILQLYGCQLDDFDLSMLLEGLPVLEQLILYFCNCIREVCISAKHLVQLRFDHCRDLRTAELDTPNLKFFCFDDNPISFISKGPTLKLTEANIYLKPGMCNCDIILVKFLSKLCHCERMYICVASEEDLIVREKVRRKRKSPLRGLKHLSVGLRASITKHKSVKFVEALMWLAPCA